GRLSHDRSGAGRQRHERFPAKIQVRPGQNRPDGAPDVQHGEVARMAGPLRLSFIGCGFITAVHSRNLRALGADVVAAYASRDRAKADRYCRSFGGARSYGDYAAAIEDPAIDAVVIAVPPKWHLDLTLQALAGDKHVLIEKR